ncbi:FG-GAP repeat domain-containing protein [Actinoplanes sp. NPDC049265]|uniref:FG-GAP repeat domain-containing protein n=1 Tax=Actinoplanes sp. NPDC049265 TaxID=3363902 RepID=UPI0037210408
MMFAANSRLVRLSAGLTGVAVALTTVLSGGAGYAKQPDPALGDAARAAQHALGRTAGLGPVTTQATDELNFGDLTGDGKADLAAVDTAGRLWVYPGKALVYPGTGPRSTSYFAARFQAGSGWSGYSSLVRHGDWNNDGRQDILARDASGRLFLFAGTGTTPRVVQNGVQVGEGWNTYADLVGIGDANGDGFDDLMGRAAGRLVIYYGTGVATAPFRRTTATGGSGWNGDLLTAVGDWTGDGHTEFLFRKSNDEVWLYQGTTSGFPANGPVLLFGQDDGGLVVDLVGMGNLTSDAVVDGEPVTQPLPDVVLTDSDGFMYVLAPDTGDDFDPQVGSGWVDYFLF